MTTTTATYLPRVLSVERMCDWFIEAIRWCGNQTPQQPPPKSVECQCRGVGAPKIVITNPAPCAFEMTATGSGPAAGTRMKWATKAFAATVQTTLASMLTELDPNVEDVCSWPMDEGKEGTGIRYRIMVTPANPTPELQG